MQDGPHVQEVMCLRLYIDAGRAARVGGNADARWQGRTYSHVHTLNLFSFFFILTFFRGGCVCVGGGAMATPLCGWTDAREDHFLLN